MADDSFAAIWDEAFALYKSQTHRDLRNDAVLARLSTVDDVLIQIEASHTAFGSWRSKHEKVWSRLSACIGPLQIFGSLGDTALQFAPFGSQAAPVLGAVMYLIKVSIVGAYE